MSIWSCRSRAVSAHPVGVQLIRLDARDNIVIAVADLRSGDLASLEGESLPIRDDVPAGHKVAAMTMPAGTDVLRYGEVIGATTTKIVAGEHVHVHNLISKRLPGRDA